MTMVVMWLDEKSVALATDSNMGSDEYEVQKLHKLNDRVMFAIEFNGIDTHAWLCQSPCEKHPYPEHWRDCSGANNIDELERIIQRDLQSRDKKIYPDFNPLIWIAGINGQGILEAFILDKTGERTKQLDPGQIIFNGSSQYILQRSIYPPPEEIFYRLKNKLDSNLIEFSGVKALEEVSIWFLNHCATMNQTIIGGKLQYQSLFINQTE